MKSQILSEDFKILKRDFTREMSNEHLHLTSHSGSKNTSLATLKGPEVGVVDVKKLFMYHALHLL